MNDLALLLVLALPPAAIVFLALIWAKGLLRIGLATAVFLVPLAVLGFARLTGDSFAALGFVALGLILLAGAVTGAVLGGMVVGLRHLRRKGATS